MGVSKLLAKARTTSERKSLSAAYQESRNQGWEPLIIIDGCNFAAMLWREYKLHDYVLPRVAEYAMIVERLYRAILASCGGAAVMVIFDGLSGEDVLECKAEEHLKRRKKKFKDSAKFAECMRNNKTHPDALITYASGQIQVHIMIISALQNEGKKKARIDYGFSHGEEIDADIALARYAIDSRCALFITSDSDFLVTLPMPIVIADSWFLGRKENNNNSDAAFSFVTY